MTDQCSIWAYEDIKESGHLGERQAMFLSAVVYATEKELRFSANDIAYYVSQIFGKGFSRNGLGSRLSELEQKGFIKKNETKIDQKTKQRVNCWVYTGRKTPKIKSVKRICCPKCNGKGIVDVFEYLDL